MTPRLRKLPCASAALGLLFATGLVACAPATVPAASGTDRAVPSASAPESAVMSEAAARSTTETETTPRPAVRSGNPAMRVTSATAPLAPGREAVVRLTATPDAECQIALYQGTTRIQDARLATTLADASGEVEWTWTTPGTPGDAAQSADGAVICTTPAGAVTSTSIIFPAQTD